MCAPPAVGSGRRTRTGSLPFYAATRRLEQPGPGFPPSLEGPRRPGWGTPPTPPGRWHPQGRPSRALSSGVAATIPRTPGLGPAGLCTWAGATRFRWQGSKAEPSSPPGPPSAPPHPRPRKGHAHKNFCHTINIFAFPPTFPMGYQLQNS